MAGLVALVVSVPGARVRAKGLEKLTAGCWTVAVVVVDGPAAGAVAVEVRTVVWRGRGWTSSNVGGGR